MRWQDKLRRGYTLGPEVKHIKGFSGSAILGDGLPSVF